MDKVVATYKKEVDFYLVYIREAHPTDGWRMAWNDGFGIEAKQPTTFLERTKVANQCSAAMNFLCPMLIDGLDDKVANDYAAFPDRLYLIDAKGHVAYKSGRGPFGYKPRELERSILMMLMEEAKTKVPKAKEKNAEEKKEPKKKKTEDDGKKKKD